MIDAKREVRMAQHRERERERERDRGHMYVVSELKSNTVGMGYLGHGRRFQSHSYAAS